MGKIFFKIFIIILVAFSLSIVINYVYMRTYGLTYNYPQNIFPLPEIADKYTLVKVGNSHAQDGLLFTRYNVKSLDLSNVSQSFEYDLAMLKMSSQQIKKNAIIIINVSPISFSQDTPKKEDYVNMNYYDGRLSPFLIPHIKLSEYVQIQILPFVRAGYLWRAQHATDMQTNAMSSFAQIFDKTVTKAKPPVVAPPTVALPIPTISFQEQLHESQDPLFNVSDIQTELNSPPDLSDERLMESVQFMSNKWYNSGGFGTQAFAANEKDLQNLIDYSLAHHWRPVLITLPISQVLLNGLEPGYLQKYVSEPLKNVDTYHLDYFNFATNPHLTQNRTLFSNSDHLNKKGASIVSYLLLQQLIQHHYLPRTADGYNY